MTGQSVIASLLACTCSYLLVQSKSGSERVVPHGPRAEAATSPTSPINSFQFYGLAIQVDSSHQPVRRYGAMVRQIAALGANTVLFSVNGYQRNAGSTEIYSIDERNPSDEQWVSLFKIAHRENLQIVFMPKVLLEEPRGREWRGVIDPGQQWAKWFSAYRRFILRYARLAAASHVEVFVVGSELVSTEKHTGRWRHLIAEIRSVFPKGLLTYSANWDHHRPIRFWGDLDMVALSSYFEMADHHNPTLAELRSSWRRIQEEILHWQQDVGLPVLFTEVGWCSQEGCSMEPWNYRRRQESSRLGLQEQRLNYEAFIETWDACPTVAGALWWEWVPDEGGPGDYGYTPKNKPAEHVLSRWFQRLRASQAGQDSAPSG